MTMLCVTGEGLSPFWQHPFSWVEGLSTLDPSPDTQWGISLLVPVSQLMGKVTHLSLGGLFIPVTLKFDLRTDPMG